MVETFWLVIIVGMLVLGELIRYLFELGNQKRLSKTLDRRKRELSYLSFITSHALSKNDPIDQSFNLYLDDLRERIGWKFHSLWRLDEEKQVVRIRFTGGLPDWYMKELSDQWLIRVGDASIGRAVSTKQPCTVNLAEVDPRFKNVSSYGERADYHCLSCYPLIGKLKTHGGFCTYGTHQNMFSLHDVKFMLTCANLYASILEDKLLSAALFQKR